MKILLPMILTFAFVGCASVPPSRSISMLPITSEPKHERYLNIAAVLVKLTKFRCTVIN
jgi:uncharacterized lipoprotein YmbA